MAPDLDAGLGLDQFAGQSHAVSEAPDAAVQDVAHAKLPCDAAHVRAPVAVMEARIAGDDEEPAILRQRRHDVFRDALGKVVFVGIARQVAEGQHRDRRLLGAAPQPGCLGLGTGPVVARADGRRHGVGFRFWRGGQFRPQPLRQGSVEPQGCCLLTACRKLVHQCAGGCFVQRIESEEILCSGRNRRIVALVHRQRQNPGGRSFPPGAPDLPFVAQPVLEGRVADCQPVQQLARPGGEGAAQGHAVTAALERRQIARVDGKPPEIENGDPVLRCQQVAPGAAEKGPKV